MSDLKEIGKHAYESISEMVAALDCDYDRLDELKDAESLDDDEKEELAELLEAADDCKNRDEALEVIQEDALSVEVRSGWGGGRRLPTGRRIYDSYRDRRSGRAHMRRT